MGLEGMIADDECLVSLSACMQHQVPDSRPALLRPSTFACPIPSLKTHVLKLSGLILWWLRCLTACSLSAGKLPLP